jgi:hypothetical protein
LFAVSSRAFIDNNEERKMRIQDASVADLTTIRKQTVKHLIDAGILTIGQLVEGWGTTTPAALGKRCKTILKRIEHSFNLLGFEVTPTKTYVLKERGG